jgi:hypothetical protein
LKYRQKNPRRKIGGSATLQADECIVAVKDNGIGFDARCAEKFSDCSSGSIRMNILAPAWALPSASVL